MKNIYYRLITIARRAKAFFSQAGWSGNYATWESANAQCTGYDADNILEKVKTATLLVKNGKAKYERDSVLFDEIEYSWPLLAALMWIANQQKNVLSVVDFGGALGSSYFQNKSFLDSLNRLSWNVVEQPSFVKEGIASIQDDHLRFFYTVDEALLNTEKVDVLLLSCTLPYIEKPYDLLDKLFSYKIPYIIVENTYFNYEERDRICIQKVPKSIYEASYPCWFLSYNSILARFEEKYSIVAEYHNDSVIFLDGRKIIYKGFIARIN